MGNENSSHVCLQCKKINMKSKTYGGASGNDGDSGMVTQAYYRPYYDEDGKYHNHDMNTTTTNYSCSNGHKWTVNFRPGSTCCSAVKPHCVRTEH
jgi:hypothetical protein